MNNVSHGRAQSTRLRRLGRHLAMWFVIAAGLGAVTALTGQASAEPAAPAALVQPAALTTVTPTASPTPGGVACTPTLTASPSTITGGGTTTLTFDDGCVCIDPPDAGTVCDYYPFALASIDAPGFTTPSTPIFPPVPYTFDVTSTDIGMRTITVTYDGETEYEPPGVYIRRTLTASVDVMVLEPTAAPSPTPTLIPGTPTPTSTPTPGPQTAVTVAESCLADNGRIDFNIVNEGLSAARYRIDFDGLSPRELTVAAGDWWRMPITGRPDGLHPVVISRDGNPVYEGMAEFSCDEDVPRVSTPEIAIVNACREGLGYLLFQMVNPTDSPKGYVIAFQNVPNRSTTAAAYGQSVRAVTGRPDGDHSYVVRRDGVITAGGVVTVNCP